ncbi:PREDICTED: protein COFACTOR ASSEMBLY OF COMPLEX C SUBUNIT B CCB3, chloroplastic [Tarenaya hassleriana]|uniref:protein COFACTOR ASSEMBLY OF COMPLEX C SUBUNIT B CCB3, chloroplastic n=1 Tax=Tarenaya hassleriana TaxID=28532 RepID=UPI00053C392C|nr:PREDICTED: protein COFACTOR ASSEMBLY OF COMPLEX C SUBUNIT B CCB3, chloroplastic [Tarenaya hassleriana]
MLLQMATSCHLLTHAHAQGGLLLVHKRGNSRISGRSRPSARTNQGCFSNLPIVSASFSHMPSDISISSSISNSPVLLEQTNPVMVTASQPMLDHLHNIFLADLDPGTAKLAIAFLGPALSAFGFLFILRIVMSWYPKLPLEKFPYVIAYAPTEPILVQTRKLIPPLAGVDVTPVVWFGLLSFLNEILVGPQGLLVLVSQQQVN